MTSGQKSAHRAHTPWIFEQPQITRREDDVRVHGFEASLALSLVVHFCQAHMHHVCVRAMRRARGADLLIWLPCKMCHKKWCAIYSKTRRSDRQTDRPNVPPGVKSFGVFWSVAGRERKRGLRRFILMGKVDRNTLCCGGGACVLWWRDLFDGCLWCASAPPLFVSDRKIALKNTSHLKCIWAEWRATTLPSFACIECKRGKKTERKLLKCTQLAFCHCNSIFMKSFRS